jgi:LysM repeat protein
MSELTPQSPERRPTVRLGNRPASHRGRDPFVARLGAIVVVGLLAIPVIGALRGGDDGAADAQPSDSVEAVETQADGTGAITLIDPSQTTIPAPAAAPAPAPAATDPATSATQQVSPATDPATNAPVATAAPTTTAAADTASEDQLVGAATLDVEDDTTPATTEAPSTTSAPTTTEATCSGEYEVAAGDYWIGIADRAGVSTEKLMSANDASSETPIYPGTTICLPPGASQPGPPPTTSTTTEPETTTTTKAPASTTTTKAPSKSTTTTAPAKSTTTTTKAPATTAPAKTYTRDEVTFIISSVFPEDQRDTALAIAQRESNLKPGVRNSCCFGLFQINWNSHKSWLAGMGITTPEQLYDPLVNAQAAYALYQRSGGWGPWGGVPG